MLIRLVKATVGKMEHNAPSQYKFHLIATWFWLASMVFVPFIIHPHRGEHWISLTILEVSLYANFATEFGAMSSALAAYPKPKKTFVNPNYRLGKDDDIDDVSGEPYAGEAHF